jgi:hypothetical protein
MAKARWVWLLLAAFSTAARAEHLPHLGYVYPAGGQRGLR